MKNNQFPLRSQQHLRTTTIYKNKPQQNSFQKIKIHLIRLNLALKKKQQLRTILDILKYLFDWYMFIFFFSFLPVHEILCIQKNNKQHQHTKIYIIQTIKSK